MKIIGILGDGEKKVMFPEKYREEAFLFESICLQNGIKIIRTHSDDYKEIDRKFSSYRVLGSHGVFVEHPEEVSPDLLWIRTSTKTCYYYDLFSTYTLIPDKKILEIGSNKYMDYLFFPDIMPKTELLCNFFANGGRKLESKIVVKAINGNGGTAVFRTTKKELLQREKDFTMRGRLAIVQDFKDFSQGFNEKITGVHDLRVCFFGGSFGYAVLRFSADGDFRCNIHSGGHYSTLEYEDIPNEVLDLTEKIKKRIKTYDSSIYALDFAFCKNEKKRYFLETNHSPGLFRKGNTEYREEANKRLILFLMNK